MKHLTVVATLMLAGCVTSPPPDPRDAFFSRLAASCGRAFEGRIVSPPVESDGAFAGKRLVMHVRECSTEAIRIPFHVGEDRSRTWIVSRTATGLRLKHDHKHEDGSEERVTQYGGDTVSAGTESRQEFPADGFTKELLVREGNVAGVDNVWAMEVRPGAIFAYELRRPNRFFRVEFDLTRPVVPPPPPWGT